MIIQYNGTRYQGWQKQTSTENTIQGKFEAIFSRRMEEPVQVDGSGRTDAGVHARGQTASVKLRDEKIMQNHPGENPENVILSYVNQYLPKDIAVIEVRKMPDRFHARLNATGKVYSYRIVTGKAPRVLMEDYSLYLPEKPDIRRIREAASFLTGTHDFKAYTSEKKSKKSTVRTIYDISVTQRDLGYETEEILITYHGDGFLFHMVRILTGTLLEAGYGKRTPESIRKTLESGAVRSDAGELVPAKGLCLERVEYDPKKEKDDGQRDYSGTL